MKIILTPVYSGQTSYCITESDDYDWFDLMSRHEWYWDGDTEDPADEFKPMKKALDEKNFKEFERLWFQLNVGDRINYNIQVK